MKMISLTTFTFVLVKKILQSNRNRTERVVERDNIKQIAWIG